MEKPKLLSGYEIVAKGVTKIDATLPDIGLKDVTPNGSWLEQKQIQAALEARKHLIEVERIEKHGTLSQAKWLDGMNRAQVTQKAGGYWQYFGYNVGKTLYLMPEEALFLMEVNCLLLKHNDVIVSLQKAYALLLNENITITEYRVYASLSRLGYKVFRHKKPPIKNIDKDKSTSIIEKEISPAKTVLETLQEPISLETPLVIDTENSDITEQPLTDSSVEIIESKTESRKEDKEELPIESIPLPTVALNTTCDVNIENIPLPFTEQNDNTEKESNNTQSDETKDSKESQNTMEIENGADKCKTDSDELNTESNSTESIATDINENEDKTSKDVMEIDSNEIVKMCTVEETASTTKSDDVVSTTVVENDSLTPPIENNDLQGVQTSPMVCSEPQVVCTPQIMEESNNSVEVHTPPIVISNDSQELPDSSGEAMEKVVDNNKDSNLAIEVDSVDSNVMDLDTPKSGDLNNFDALDKSAKKIDNFISDALIKKRNQIFNNYVNKLKSLTSRHCKPSDFKTLEKNFEIVPDMFKKLIVAVSVANAKYFPPGVVVDKFSYVLNMNRIKKISSRSRSLDSPNNVPEEVNGNHVRRIRSTSCTELPQNPQIVNATRFQPRQQFRPNFFVTQNNTHFINFNLYVQRPYLPNVYINRFQSNFQPRPNPLLRPYPNNTNVNSNMPASNVNSRKRKRSAKATHLQSIKNLAFRLKQLIMASGSPEVRNIESLHRLLSAYNFKYKAKLRLSQAFEVVSDESIVETIELDDDESSNKRQRTDSDDNYNGNLNTLRQLALKLKDLGAKGKVTSKHKRALSKAIKTFNKSYDGDIYMNSNFEIIDRKFINIESDSDQDCVIEEPEKVKSKKLRNPFNILKRRSERRSGGVYPSTSKETVNMPTDSENMDIANSSHHTPTTQDLTKIFRAHWLPPSNDFGRPEVVHKKNMSSIFAEAEKDNYIFNFMKNHFDQFNNWFEAKIAYLQHLEETEFAFQNVPIEVLQGNDTDGQTGMRPLIDADNSSDMPSLLEKLRIIRNNKEMNDATNLAIHFDVYYRDVANFKKTDPPKAHFRVVCLDESSSFPPTADIKALHSQYDDNVVIVFAVVGISSVSYLQINPVDLPVYIPSDHSE
ncbi:tRNA splicing endonuclease subunit 54 [Anticarsia gemmatalis]|uniref:tRNA splicing endonuclease subunit 54 n=1 Tax=Anticarsia gemmatalis TaxID=129554 RepID=UPI003F75E7D6